MLLVQTKDNKEGNVIHAQETTNWKTGRKIWWHRAWIEFNQISSLDDIHCSALKFGAAIGSTILTSEQQLGGKYNSIGAKSIARAGSAQVTVMATAGSPRIYVKHAAMITRRPRRTSNDATPRVNKNNVAVDNNIRVSDSNVLLKQNDRFHVKKQSGTIHVHGAKKNEEDEDQDQEYFWRGGYGYPSYGYNYRYRNWW